MKVSALKAPVPSYRRGGPKKTEEPDEEDEDDSYEDESDDSQDEEARPPMPAAPPPPVPPPVIEDDGDEEVRLAMEMAMAAAQNPGLSAAELQKLVAGKNQQLELVGKVQEKKDQEAAARKAAAKEEATQRWNEQKSKAASWWNKTKEVAQKKAAELQFQAEKQLYADQIKRDPEVIQIRKNLKAARKRLKATRLIGNRVETRHAFKRQKMESRLVDLNERLANAQNLMTGPSFNVHEYAKAMMKATKRWKKKGTDQELSLEAQLCRNMHQMLAMEKTKAKGHKAAKAIKQYLTRCKAWLVDKQHECEVHSMSLEVMGRSRTALYEQMLAKQDALIKRLSESKEFIEEDLTAPDDSPLNVPKEESEKYLTQATLNALRGKPYDAKIEYLKIEPPPTEDLPKKVVEHRKPPPPKQQQPELVVETKPVLDDDEHSQLSDPDDGDEEDESENFGHDTPWSKKDVVEDDVDDEPQAKE